MSSQAQAALPDTRYGIPDPEGLASAMSFAAIENRGEAAPVRDGRGRGCVERCFNPVHIHTDLTVTLCVCTCNVLP